MKYMLRATMLGLMLFGMQAAFGAGNSGIFHDVNLHPSLKITFINQSGQVVELRATVERNNKLIPYYKHLPDSNNQVVFDLPEGKDISYFYTGYGKTYEYTIPWIKLSPYGPHVTVTLKVKKGLLGRWSFVHTISNTEKPDNELSLEDLVMVPESHN